MYSLHLYRFIFFGHYNYTDFVLDHSSKGGAVAQSVERMTPGEEVPGLIPAVAACSLLVRSVSDCQYNVTC